MLPWVQEFKYGHSHGRAREGGGSGGFTGRYGHGHGRAWGGGSGASRPPSLCCSKFDLYTKSSSLPDVAALRPYYQGLVDKYCPGVLCW